MINIFIAIIALIPILGFSIKIELKGETKIIKSKLTLIDNSIIKGPGIIKLKSSSSGIFLNGKNITIENVHFVVEDNTLKQNSVLHIEDGAKNIKIQGNYFEGARYTILKADINTKKDKNLLFKKRATDIYFLNNVCEGQYSRHLYLASIENIKILNNKFKNSTRDSIRLRQNIKKIFILNNTFENIGQKSKESSDGIDSYWSGEELIISNNHFSGIQTHGLDIKGLSPDSVGKTSKVIISDNIFKDIQYSGVLLSSGNNIEKKDNLVSDFSIRGNQFFNINLNNVNKNDAAIFLRHGVSNVIISSNIINANYSHGIVIGNFAKNTIQTTDVLVNSNIIQSKYEPVFIHAANRIQVINNNLFKKNVKHIKSYKLYKSSEFLILNNL